MTVVAIMLVMFFTCQSAKVRLVDVDEVDSLVIRPDVDCYIVGCNRCDTSPYICDDCVDSSACCSRFCDECNGTNCKKCLAGFKLSPLKICVP